MRAIIKLFRSARVQRRSGSPLECMKEQKRRDYGEGEMVNEKGKERREPAEGQEW